MSSEVQPVPEGYATVAPWIVTFIVLLFEKALRAGATSVTELRNFRWGDRGGRIRDPLDNVWWLSEHIEDVEPETQTRRWAEPEYLESVCYAQESLDRELSRNGETT